MNSPERHLKDFAGAGTPLAAWQACAALAALPHTRIEALLPAHGRLFIVAPHPDDEILMCGGLLASLTPEQAAQVVLVSVSDGEGSHPGSREWPPERLQRERPRESEEAMRRLGLRTDSLGWQRLGLRDTAVARDEARLSEIIAAQISAHDTVLTTWREDGHCDHEASARACLAATQARGAQLFEVPVWAWHWASPEDPRLPWARACKLPLSGFALARKRAAIAAHASQIHPCEGHAPVLPAGALARLLRPFELVFT